MKSFLKSSTYKGGEKGNNTYPFTIYKSSFSPKTKDQQKSRAKKIPNNWNWNCFNLLFKTGTKYHKSQVLTNIVNCQCCTVLDFKRNLWSQFYFYFTFFLDGTFNLILGFLNLPILVIFTQKKKLVISLKKFSFISITHNYFFKNCLVICICSPSAHNSK